MRLIDKLYKNSRADCSARYVLKSYAREDVVIAHAIVPLGQYFIIKGKRKYFAFFNSQTTILNGQNLFLVTLKFARMMDGDYSSKLKIIDEAAWEKLNQIEFAEKL